jgi:hypothetical protein
VKHASSEARHNSDFFICFFVSCFLFGFAE